MKNRFLNSPFAKGFVGAALLGSAGAAMADTSFDVTLVTAAVLLAAAAVGTIGGAVASGPKVTGAAWKWIKGMIS